MQHCALPRLWDTCTYAWQLRIIAPDNGAAVDALPLDIAFEIGFAETDKAS